MQKEFKEAMRNNAIFCPIDIIADGEVHRFSNNSERKENAWYVFHENSKGSYGGAYGDWTRGETYNWSSFSTSLSPRQQQEHITRIEEKRKIHEKETVARQGSASLKASEIWETLEVKGTSPYLQRKQVNAYGIRFGSSESIAIPLCDVSGRLWSLQFIDSTGCKRFLKGGKKKGCFHSLGVLDTSSQVYVCEGYATAASLYEATEIAIIVAFDAGNLESVVRAIRQKYSNISITIAADNDQWKEVNTGLETAQAVAKKNTVQVIYPEFTDAIETDSKPTDFNDLHVLGGLDAVRKQLLKGGA
tara:strand:+ start:907 stop:1815 length:909 start_codon:yes stop_codon:yes gene_type:complete